METDANGLEGLGHAEAAEPLGAREGGAAGLYPPGECAEMDPGERMGSTLGRGSGAPGSVRRLHAAAPLERRVAVSDQSGDEVSRVLPQLRIDELLDELQIRLATVRSSRDRVRQLLEAVVGIGAGLDLEQSLTRIVQAAVSLVDARYGALGVIGGDQRLSRFITVGLSEGEIAAIGPYPEGHGLLGELIRHPVPLRTEELSAHPNSYGFPANHPPMHSFLGVPIRVREEVYGNLYLTEKQGGAPFDADDEAVLTALAAAAGVAVDNARLYDDSRRRQEWLATTSELTRGLLSGQDPDDALAEFAQRVRAFAGADVALVALPEEPDGGLLVIAADGAGAEVVRGSAVELEGTLLGSVFKSGRRALVADAAKEGGAGGGGLPADVRPALVVPLGAAGQVRGVLALGRGAQGVPFAGGVGDLTAELAMQASVVLELAQRRKDSELLSLYADRDRIGRDLHDLAIQRLFATSMSLQGAYKITQKPAVARRIAQAIEDLDGTIKVIRSTIFALHSHELEEEDAPSVRALVLEECEQAAGSLGFPPAVRFTGPVDLLVNEQVAGHLLPVLRETLSNAARHARATRVEVDLAAADSKVTLSVADDGVGIAPGGRRSGLANLRERAQQLGGTFTIGAGPNGGTVAVWSVPASLDGTEDTHGAQDA